jgi:hypothetical protein
MASFVEMTYIAGQPSIQARVEYCLKKAAVAVMAEAANTENHADRVVFAKKVLDGEAGITHATMAAMTNSTITAGGNPAAAPNFGVSDGDLEFTVNSMFNAFAGVALS